MPSSTARKESQMKDSSAATSSELKQSNNEKSKYLKKAEEVAAYVKLQTYIELWHEAKEKYKALDTDLPEETERKEKEYLLWKAMFPLPKDVEKIEEAGHIAKIYVLKEAIDEDVNYNDLSQEIISDIEVKKKRIQREVTILQNSLETLEKAEQSITELKD